MKLSSVCLGGVCEISTRLKAPELIAYSPICDSISISCKTWYGMGGVGAAMVAVLARKSVQDGKL